MTCLTCWLYEYRNNEATLWTLMSLLLVLDTRLMCGHQENHRCGVDFLVNSVVFLTVHHSAWLRVAKGVLFCGFHIMESKAFLHFMHLIRLAHLVWEPSVLVAASVICCLSVICPASDLGNYVRYARNFASHTRHWGRRARIWRQILHQR